MASSPQVSAGVRRAGPAESWAFVFLVAAVFTSPLGSNLHLPGHPSIFPYRIFLTVFALFEAARLLLDPRGRPRLHLLHPAVWVAGLALWGTVSIAWAAHTGAALRYVVFLWQAALLVYGVSVYGTTKRRLALLFAAGIASLLAVISGAFFERTTGYHFPVSMLRDPEALQHQFLFTSFFHNGNDLATFLMLWMPLMLLLYLAGRRLSLRLAGLAVAFLCGYLIVYSLSRANTIGMGAGLLVMFGLSVQRRLGAWLALVFLALAAFLLMPPLPRYFVTQAALRLVREATVGFGEDRVRSQLTHECLTLVRQTRGLGVGAGGAETAIQQLRLNGNETGTDIVDPHNWWLEVMTNLGVIGFLWYAVFYVGLMVALLRVRLQELSRDPSAAYLSLGLLVGLVGFIIGCISSSSVLTLNAIWFQFGLAGALLETVRAKRRKQAKAAPQPNPNPA